MNKRDLARAVAVQSDVELGTVLRVLDGFTDVVTAMVSRGEPVQITGFAKFVKVSRPARLGRNPRTGEQIRIKASTRARISPAKTFKDAVLSGTVPRLASGVWPLDPAAVKRAGAQQLASGVSKAAAGKKATVKRAPAKKATAGRTAATRRR